MVYIEESDISDSELVQRKMVEWLGLLRVTSSNSVIKNELV